jgi:NADH-quinone oxidoreductase subunit I
MLCVTSCPQDALEFSNDFEQAVFTRDKLVKQLNYRPEPEEPVAPAAKAVEVKKEDAGSVNTENK